MKFQSLEIPRPNFSNPWKYVARLLALTISLNSRAGEKFTTEQTTNEIRVLADGKLFCAYVFRGAPKPYVYPLTAPDGIRLNREFPMQNIAGESHDHPHHRSMWFGHIDINGVDFWDIAKGAGTVETDGTPETKIAGDVVVLRARDRWISADSKIIARDERELHFGELPGGERFVDFAITLRGENGSELKFGDGKDGAMGLRLRDEFNFKNTNTVARNSAGDDKKTIWGKRARWVDYETEISGAPHGVALFDDPKNPNSPPRFHARDFGLLAANPFGEKPFDPKSEKTGGFTIPAGQSATWRYRVILYAGRKNTADVENLLQQFSQEAGAKP